MTSPLISASGRLALALQGFCLLHGQTENIRLNPLAYILNRSLRFSWRSRRLAGVTYKRHRTMEELCMTPYIEVNGDFVHRRIALSGQQRSSKEKDFYCHLPWIVSSFSFLSEASLPHHSISLVEEQVQGRPFGKWSCSSYNYNQHLFVKHPEAFGCLTHMGIRTQHFQFPAPRYYFPKY